MKPKPSYIGHRKRLKSRLSKSGLDSFEPHEVLEIILTFVIPRKDTKPIAWDLIQKFGSISNVLDAKEHDLRSIKGIGDIAAEFLVLMRQVIKRYFYEELKTRGSLKTPQDAAAYCRASLEGEKDEIFEVIYLTTRNTIIKSERVAIGTIDRASVSPRKIVENALRHKAAGLIFVHNHPSGDPSPSDEDIQITKEISDAAKVLGITVHDHIIVGKGSYYSLRANGYIKKN